MVMTFETERRGYSDTQRHKINHAAQTQKDKQLRNNDHAAVQNGKKEKKRNWKIHKTSYAS